MKQLAMTPELSGMIKKAVGEDVDTNDLAVFETIALNTKPLPGKRGTIFENAVVAPLTLAQMADNINGGNHLPVMADHILEGSPKGRFFHAGMHYGDDGLELRALFYADPTEKDLITKLNSGTLDEVSVQFLSSSFLCSDCGWDYFSEGTNKNIDTRTCANGHTIGENGVHADMVGLNQFVELSVVARGAADNPKIVGKSQSKLAPESTYRLAAKGFEPDALVLRASISAKEEDIMDVPALTAAYTDEVRKAATLTVENSNLTASLAAANTAKDAALADVTRLTAELATAQAAKPEGYDETVAERTAALAYFGEQYDHLTVASGKPKVEGEARPKTVAEFKAKIGEMTGGLTSILPVGGRAVAAGAEDTPEAKPTAKFAFGVKK